MGKKCTSVIVPGFRKSVYRVEFKSVISCLQGMSDTCMLPTKLPWQLIKSIINLCGYYYQENVLV